MKLVLFSALLAVLGSGVDARRRSIPWFQPVKRNDYGLGKRDASPLEDNWDNMVCRGKTLVAQLAADDKGAGQLMTPVVNTVAAIAINPSDAEMEGWAWEDYTDYSFDAKHWGIENALKGLQLDTKDIKDGGDNNGSLWWHNGGGFHNRPKTGGTYVSIANLKGSTLISNAKFSAEKMANKVDKNNLPKVDKFSDIGFLQWGDTKHAPSKVIYTPVMNGVTQNICSRALANAGWDLDVWPGIGFDTWTEEGLAILGSPYGTDLAFMLMQHKKQWGNVGVRRVTIFKDDHDDHDGPQPPSLLFELIGGGGSTAPTAPSQSSSSSEPAAACTKAPLSLDDDDGDNEGPDPVSPTSAPANTGSFLPDPTWNKRAVVTTATAVVTAGPNWFWGNLV